MGALLAAAAVSAAASWRCPAFLDIALRLPTPPGPLTGNMADDTLDFSGRRVCEDNREDDEEEMARLRAIHLQEHGEATRVK